MRHHHLPLAQFSMFGPSTFFSTLIGINGRHSDELPTFFPSYHVWFLTKDKLPSVYDLETECGRLKSNTNELTVFIEIYLLVSMDGFPIQQNFQFDCISCLFGWHFDDSLE